MGYNNLARHLILKIILYMEDKRLFDVVPMPEVPQEKCNKVSSLEILGTKTQNWRGSEAVRE